MKPLWCIAAIAALGTIFAQPLRAELVAFYNFNDASNEDVAVDSSGHGNDGDIFVAVYTDDGDGHTGKPGDRALDFGLYDDGSYVELTTAADGAFDSLVDSDQFTISLWILGSDEQPQPQWTFYAGPGRQLGSHIPWSDSTIYFDVAGCCGPNQRISLNEPDPELWSGQWNHYAFVKDEGYTAIYQNGELWHDSGADVKDPLTGITEFYIGSGPPGDQRSYSGWIDDFGVWDVALSEGDIAKLFDGTFFGGGVTGDFDNSGVLDAPDIDDLTKQSAARTNPQPYDLTGDSLVDEQDVKFWIKDLFNSWVGDANLDQEFNSSDLVSVLASGTYEAQIEAVWSTGDFNGDGRANSTDLVAALADGGYEQGKPPAANAVPEPASSLLLLVGLLMLSGRSRTRSK
jgi:hypothetical protein